MKGAAGSDRWRLSTRSAAVRCTSSSIAIRTAAARWHRAGKPGFARQWLVPRRNTSDAVRVLTGKAPFRTRFRGQPERFAEPAAAKPRVIGWPCRRPGYREIRPNLSPDNGREGSSRQMGAPGRDISQHPCSTAGFAGFVPEFSGYSGVAVSTVGSFSHAAPDLRHCQRIFSPNVGRHECDIFLRRDLRAMGIGGAHRVAAALSPARHLRKSGQYRRSLPSRAEGIFCSQRVHNGIQRVVESTTVGLRVTIGIAKSAAACLCFGP